MPTRNPKGLAVDMEPADVMLTNAWGRSPYNIARSLASRRLRVIVGTDKFLGMAALSRFATATFRHPSAFEDPRAFVGSIAEALRRYAPRVLIPTGEDTLVVAKYVDDLQKS